MSALLSRRRFLQSGAVALGAGALSACGATPTPQVIKETVVVTQEVEKVIEKTVEVVVTPTPAPTEEKVTLDFIFGTEPPTIDPAITEDTTSVWLVEQLFLGLTDYDDDTLEVVPELATSWEVSEDGTVYTFHLRNDAKWVRLVGDQVEEVGPVTAQDVVYGVLRSLDPRTGSPYAYVPTTVLAGAADLVDADPDEVGPEGLRSCAPRWA